MIKRIVFLLLLSLCCVKPALAQTDVETKVEAVESSLRNNPFETGVFINPDTGHIMRVFVGGPTSVMLDRSYVYELKLTVFTHNHPKAEGLVYFSVQDITFATLYDLNQMRATGYDEHGVATTCVADRGNLNFWPTGLPDYTVEMVNVSPKGTTPVYIGQMVNEGETVIGNMMKRYGENQTWTMLFAKWGIAYRCFHGE